MKATELLPKPPHFRHFDFLTFGIIQLCALYYCACFPYEPAISRNGNALDASSRNGYSTSGNRRKVVYSQNQAKPWCIFIIHLYIRLAAETNSLYDKLNSPQLRRSGIEICETRQISLPLWW